MENNLKKDFLAENNSPLHVKIFCHGKSIFKDKACRMLSKSINIMTISFKNPVIVLSIGFPYRKLKICLFWLNVFDKHQHAR